MKTVSDHIVTTADAQQRTLDRMRRGVEGMSQL